MRGSNFDGLVRSPVTDVPDRVGLVLRIPVTAGVNAIDRAARRAEQRWGHFRRVMPPLTQPVVDVWVAVIQGRRKKGAYGSGHPFCLVPTRSCPVHSFGSEGASLGHDLTQHHQDPALRGHQPRPAAHAGGRTVSRPSTTKPERLRSLNQCSACGRSAANRSIGRATSIIRSPLRRSNTVGAARNGVTPLGQNVRAALRVAIQRVSPDARNAVTPSGGSM